MAQQLRSSQIDPIHVVLIVAGVFAIGSVGFFLAILMGRAYAPGAPVPTITGELTGSQKQSIVNSLSSASTSAVVASISGTSSQAVGLPESSTTVPAQQADQNDSQAAAKLNILNSLNAH